MSLLKLGAWPGATVAVAPVARALACSPLSRLSPAHRSRAPRPQPDLGCRDASRLKATAPWGPSAHCSTRWVAVARKPASPRHSRHAAKPTGCSPEAAGTPPRSKPPAVSPRTGVSRFRWRCPSKAGERSGHSCCPPPRRPVGHCSPTAKLWLSYGSVPTAEIGTQRRPEGSRHRGFRVNSTVSPVPSLRVSLSFRTR